jgi:glucose/mannose-6-phosphate isomerase
VSALDDDALIATVDRSGMAEVVEAAADHWRDGATRARAVPLEGIPDHAGLSGVVVCGMGGSGIAGDVGAATAAAQGVLPVWVAKGFTLPAFAGPHTLVMLVSYSGNTAETLACFEQAHARGAQIVIVATGGRLGEMAHAHGYPLIVPLAGMQPRAAFAYLASAVLVVCERLGVVADLTGDLVEIDEVLREQTARCGRASRGEDNPAKTLATSLEGALPVVWGQEGHLAVAAMRWKTQLNENAKVPAYASIFPELDHNEIVGVGPGSPPADGMAICALRSATEETRLTRRIAATLAVARGAGARVLEANLRGTSSLAQLASAVQLGDFVSTYLAVLRGVDPTPVEAITRLKADLS